MPKTVRSRVTGWCSAAGGMRGCAADEAGCVVEVVGLLPEGRGGAAVELGCASSLGDDGCAAGCCAAEGLALTSSSCTCSKSLLLTPDVGEASLLMLWPRWTQEKQFGVCCISEPIGCLCCAAALCRNRTPVCPKMRNKCTQPLLGPHTTTPVAAALKHASCIDRHLMEEQPSMDMPADRHLVAQGAEAVRASCSHEYHINHIIHNARCTACLVVHLSPAAGNHQATLSQAVPTPRP